MSIESEITRLVNEVATQKTLLNELEEALDGKAVGGGSSDGDGIVLGNENLADVNSIMANKYIGTDGTEKPYNTWSITSYIPVDSNKKYSVAPFNLLKDMQYSAFYDGNKNYIRAVKSTDFSVNKILVLVPPAEAKFVRFSTDTSQVQICEVYEVEGE